MYYSSYSWVNPHKSCTHVRYLLLPLFILFWTHHYPLEFDRIPIEPVHCMLWLESSQIPVSPLPCLNLDKTSTSQALALFQSKPSISSSMSYSGPNQYPQRCLYCNPLSRRGYLWNGLMEITHSNYRGFLKNMWKSLCIIRRKDAKQPSKRCCHTRSEYCQNHSQNPFHSLSLRKKKFSNLIYC